MPLQIIPHSIRGLWRLITNRITWTTLAILAQLVLIVVVVQRFQKQSIYIEGFFLILSVSMVIWILNSRKTPTYQLAWIIPILAFPVFGGLFYLILGGNQITPYARKKLQEISDNMSELAASALNGNAMLLKMAAENRRYGAQSLYIDRYTLLPPFQHTQTLYFPSGEAFFDQLIIELEKAEEFIFLEFFIIAEGHMWSTLFEILMRKVNAGVDVRLIYDDFGAIMRLPRHFRRDLEAAGIRVAVFEPFHPVLSMRFNNRDHRKIIVIDGHTAFTGGANLADEYINHIHPYGYWKDSMLMILGDAANGFTVMFLSMWDYLTHDSTDSSKFLRRAAEDIPNDGYVQPFYDSPLDNELVGETVFRNLIGQAMDRVVIFTPYLVISHEMQTTITAAAKRGVSIHIVTPGKPDNKWFVQSVGRASYEDLVRAGVHIYEYQPGFLHSKILLVDDQIAFVGTLNMDYRSMYLHFECGAMLYGGSTIEAISIDMRDTLYYDCHEITLDVITAVPLWRRFGRSLIKVFAPLM